MAVVSNVDFGEFKVQITFEDPSNQLAVRTTVSGLDLAFVGADEAAVAAQLTACFPDHTEPTEYFAYTVEGVTRRVFFAQVSGASDEAGVEFHSRDHSHGAPRNCDRTQGGGDRKDDRRNFQDGRW